MLALFTLALAVYANGQQPRPGNDAFNIELKQQNAEVYHEQSFGKNEFNYGYQVMKTNSQFQHKVKGPDDVTYGCYGYIDPQGEKHLVYYIADRLGYRLVAPDQPTKVFTERVANSVKQLDAELAGRKLNEKVVAWNDLYLPESCRRLDEILTITLPPVAAKPTEAPPVIGGAQIKYPDTTDKAPQTGPGPELALTAPIGTNRPPTTVPEQQLQESFSGGANEPNEKDGGVPLIDTPEIENEIRTTALPLPSTNRPPASNVMAGPPSPADPTGRPVAPVDPQEFDGYTYATPPSPPASHSTGDCGKRPHGDDDGVPALGRYNGYVFPINRNCDDSGRSVNQLLAQMEAVNEKVLGVSEMLHTLSDQEAAANGTSCGKVLELLHLQSRTPLLVYVPILIPYVDGSSEPKPTVANIRRSPINPASYAYQKMCADCK